MSDAEDDARSEGDEPASTNLVDQINGETRRQATATVRGVLKKLNKTYGGSIIKKEDMLPSTLEKFNQFCENHGILDLAK